MSMNTGFCVLGCWHGPSNRDIHVIQGLRTNVTFRPARGYDAGLTGTIADRDICVTNRDIYVMVPWHDPENTGQTCKMADRPQNPKPRHLCHGSPTTPTTPA
jgi:hypothetical protein